MNTSQKDLDCNIYLLQCLRIWVFKIDDYSKCTISPCRDAEKMIGFQVLLDLLFQHERQGQICHKANKYLWSAQKSQKISIIRAHKGEDDCVSSKRALSKGGCFSRQPGPARREMESQWVAHSLSQLAHLSAVWFWSLFRHTEKLLRSLFFCV